jgi:hypothetical protein
MKKLCVLAVLAMFGLSLNAQTNDGGLTDTSGISNSWYVGVNGGLPVGDSGDFSSFAIAVDLGYTFDLSENFALSIESGYANYFGKDNFSNFSYIPIAGVASAKLSEDLSVEGGAGYAINISMGGNGGDVYWRGGFSYSVDEEDEVELTIGYRSVIGENGFSVDGAFVGARLRF